MMSNQLSDLEFMKSPEKWPHMVLPLKNNNDQVACLTESSGQFYIILANMYALRDHTTDEWELTTPEKLIKQGWKID